MTDWCRKAMLRRGSGDEAGAGRVPHKEARHVAFLDDGNSDDNHDSSSSDKGEEAEEWVRFGMVKVGHVYEVRGGIGTDGACAHGEATAHVWDADAATVLQGTVRWDAEGTVRLEARRSGLCVVHGAARCARCGAVRRVAVEAKIMAANKGTPSLRDGVRCVCTCHTGDSDSDSDSDSESDSESDEST